MQLVIRTLNVLRHLRQNSAGQSLNELSAALDIPSPTLHRLLGVLSDEGFVVRSADKRYALGPAALSLATGARPLVEVARDHMRTLSELTQETIFLTELVGDKAICVALVEGTRPLRLFVRVGQELPLHAAASARAILAQLPDDKVGRLLGAKPLTAYTDETPTTLDDVRRHLTELRRRGYDVCDQELDRNVIAISAPIPGSGPAAPASLTIAAPHDRVTGGVRERWTAALVDAALATTAGLGIRPQLALDA